MKRQDRLAWACPLTSLSVFESLCLCFARRSSNPVIAERGTRTDPVAVCGWTDRCHSSQGSYQGVGGSH